MDRTSTTLTEALDHTTADLGRTDTKAGLILTLDGLLVASLSLLGTGLKGPALVLAATGAVALIASVVLALYVIRPRIGGSTYQDRASYAFYAEASPEDLAQALAEDRRQDRLQVLSLIALRKMRLLRVAGDTTLVAVVTIAAAILTR
ncbi:Pycsar system effector family protein [Streptomyces albidoflavus]|uniref:Pycsar system effector family protein n=1 Tax=Streptomyces albidoflavus TaxID=1886 RepID=UPI0033E32931